MSDWETVTPDDWETVGATKELLPPAMRKRTLANDYQRLTPDQRNDANNKYYLEKVSPNLAPSQRGEALKQFKGLFPYEADPTRDMSGAETFAAGMGKGVTDYGRGAGQLTGLVSRDDVEESRRLDAPLMKTTGGKAGDFTGKALPALAAGFVPGAASYVGAGVIGAGQGALEPVGNDESRLLNIGIGTAAGPTAQYAGANVIPAIARGVKAVIEPFTRGGQEKIAARTLQRFSSDPNQAATNLTAAKELVPGSKPTTAEVAQDAGLAQLQRTLSNNNPQLANELSERALDQNSARLAALHELTKYGSTLDSAMERRAAAGAQLYERAFGQPIKVDDAIKTLTTRPSFKSALERAQRIAEEEGAPIKNLFDQEGKFASTRALHYVKMGFDDLINDATQSGIGKTELNAIKNTRGQLLDWMSENNPAYGTARTRFEKMSRPINREEVSREITSRATRSQLPNMRGEPTLYPDAFSRTLKDDGEAVVKATTGRVGKTLDDVMTPAQMETLRNVRGDMSRAVTARDAGRAVGSNTAQNLAGSNLVRQILGPLGAPESWAEGTVLQSVMRPAQWIAKMGETGVQDRLNGAMLDPKEAANLLRLAIKDPGALEALRTPAARRLLGISPELVGAEQQVYNRDR